MMTNSESWKLLTEMCRKINDSDFAGMKALVEHQLTTLDQHHYEAILEGIEMTSEFITKEQDFVRKFMIAIHDVEFKSLRTSLRAGFLQTYINDLDKEANAQPEHKEEDVLVKSAVIGS